MYRQISVDKEDCDLQQILWRANPGEPLRTYHLTTDTYGTTPASFIATQCLIALAEGIEHQYLIAVKEIKQQRWQQYYIQIEDFKEISILRKAKPGDADIF